MLLNCRTSKPPAYGAFRKRLEARHHFLSREPLVLKLAGLRAFTSPFFANRVEAADSSATINRDGREPLALAVEPTP